MHPSDNIFQKKIEKTPTNTGFCIDCETIRTVETLPDTKNNPERVKLHLKQHRQTLDYMGLIFERLSAYPPPHPPPHFWDI